MFVLLAENHAICHLHGTLLGCASQAEKSMTYTHKDLGIVDFHAIDKRECDPKGIIPKHHKYVCGACATGTNGRVICSMIRPDDGHEILWCVCSCDKQEPTILIRDCEDVVTFQSPTAKEFVPAENWPPELAKLYNEASLSLSAGAYTACALVCRKLLMSTACHEGDNDGKRFVEYVDYITNTVLTFPKARESIDRIRGIGNDANHDVAFVSSDDARRAMQIVTYLLNTLYSLPSA